MMTLATLLIRNMLMLFNLTYCNHALNHFSVIDHSIVSSNIYDSITTSNVLCDPTNISPHNAISLSISRYLPGPSSKDG